MCLCSLTHMQTSVNARGAVVELFVELLQVRVAIVDRSKELPPDMTEVRWRLCHRSINVAPCLLTSQLAATGRSL